jgi:hypothetical protein
MGEQRTKMDPINPAAFLSWGRPCTGPDSERLPTYRRILELSFRKALVFTGSGPIRMSRDPSPKFTRRQFVKTTAATMAVACPSQWLRGAPEDVPLTFPGMPIVDVHQHPFLGRTVREAETHQRNTGCICSIMMPSAPAGPQVGGNAWAQGLTRASNGRWVYCANASVGMSDVAKELEPFLSKDAVGIGELKEPIQSDSAYIHRVADVAATHDVPVLIHFEEGSFNSGFARFYKVIDKHPNTRFIGHAQTFWAQVDAKCPPDAHGYPRGRITPGGMSDRWLSDYPNFFGDLSSGSGNGALARDPEFMAEFLVRHQDKLVYGSDCPCKTGVGPICIAAVKQRLLKQICPSQPVLEKLLYRNANKIYRWPKAAA